MSYESYWVLSLSGMLQQTPLVRHDYVRGKLSFKEWAYEEVCKFYYPNYSEIICISKGIILVSNLYSMKGSCLKGFKIYSWSYYHLILYGWMLEIVIKLFRNWLADICTQENLVPTRLKEIKSVKWSVSSKSHLPPRNCNCPVSLALGTCQHISSDWNLHLHTHADLQISLFESSRIIHYTE